MSGVWLVIVASLRKRMTLATSLVALVFVAAMFLNISLLLAFCFDDYFDERSAAVNAPHFLLVEEERLYSQEQENYLNRYKGIKHFEREKAVLAVASISSDGGNLPARFLFLDATTPRHMDKLILVEGKQPKAEDEICLPYSFKTEGYAIGDYFQLRAFNSDISYRISGFTEEIIIGSAYNQDYQVYLSYGGYKSIRSKTSGEHIILRVQLEDPAADTVLNKDFNKHFFFAPSSTSEGQANIISIDLSQAKLSRTYMLAVTSVLLLAFTALALSVIAFLLLFGIHSYIEENLLNIASLKVVGYTEKQLLVIVASVFGGLVCLGVVLGIACSYLILPSASQVLEQQTTLMWQPGFDLLSSATAFGLIMLVMFGVILFSARKVRTLSILVALRQGLFTHNFKKNRFALDRSPGSLSILMLLKNIVQSKGQLAITFIFMVALTFALVAEGAICSSLEQRSDHFAKVLFGELPDARFTANSFDEAEEIKGFIEREPNVRKVFYYQDDRVMIENYQVQSIVTDDFSLFEGALLYEGRYPKHDNEICISGSLADSSALKINDTVNVAKGPEVSRYLVVGLIQTVNNNGLVCVMTTSGIRVVHPEFKLQQLFVYLHNENMTPALIDTIDARYDNALATSIDFKKAIDIQLFSYSSALFWIVIMLMTVTVFLLVLALYLMLKSMILRRWRELGIQRALGVTDFQLMNRLALSFMPSIILGLAVGGALGVFCFNPLFVMLTRSIGIVMTSLSAPILLAIFICVALAVFAYIFILLIAWRIREISAYELIAE
jgi:putative ABC transport system permease protein